MAEVRLTSEELYSMTFKQLYEVLMDISEDNKEAKKVLAKVREGINVKFDIEIILNNYYEEFPLKKSVRVFGYGRINLFTFLREVEERKHLIRTTILNSMELDDRIGIYGDKS